MDKYCQNPTCQNEAVEQVPVSVKEPSDQNRALCATCHEAYSWGVQHGLHHRAPGLQILPPPKEKGSKPLYRAVYVLDVCSDDTHEAARQTYEIMWDPGSLRPVLHILDADGCDTVVDLAAESSEEQTRPRLQESDKEARKFVAASATRCPKCSSRDVDFTSVEIEGQSAYQKASCQDCDTMFYVVYRLVGFALEVDDSMEVHSIAEDFREIKE